MPVVKLLESKLTRILDVDKRYVRETSPNVGLARCMVALAHIRAEPVWLRQEARLTKTILFPLWAGWMNFAGAAVELQCAKIWA